MAPLAAFHTVHPAVSQEVDRKAGIAGKAVAATPAPTEKVPGSH
jgi:hypothetical protein